MSDDASRYPFQYERAAVGHMVTDRLHARAGTHQHGIMQSLRIAVRNYCARAKEMMLQFRPQQRENKKARHGALVQSTASGPARSPCAPLRAAWRLEQGPRFPCTRRPCKLATDSVASTHRDHGAQRATGPCPNTTISSHPQSRKQQLVRQSIAGPRA